MYKEEIITFFYKTMDVLQVIRLNFGVRKAQGEPKI